MIQNSYLLNFIPCKLDITSTTFIDTKKIKNEIELPPSGKKIGFNLLDGTDFTIPSFIDTIQNSPVYHKLPTQSKNSMCIIAINEEEPIIAKGALYECNLC